MGNCSNKEEHIQRTKTSLHLAPELDVDKENVAAPGNSLPVAATNTTPQREHQKNVAAPGNSLPVAATNTTPQREHTEITKAPTGALTHDKSQPGNSIPQTMTADKSQPGNSTPQTMNADSQARCKWHGAYNRVREMRYDLDGDGILSEIEIKMRAQSNADKCLEFISTQIRNNRKRPDEKAAKVVARLQTKVGRQSARTLVGGAGMRSIDWSAGSAANWNYVSHPIVGTHGFLYEADSDKLSWNMEEQSVVFDQPMEEGLAKLKASPSEWRALYYENNQPNSRYYLIRRVPGIEVTLDVPQGQAAWTCVLANYVAYDLTVPLTKDTHTDRLCSVGFGGEQLMGTVRPGRGQGYADSPATCMVDSVSPDDVRQGSVGDCWLLSAISAMAEYEGAILQLFRNNAVDIRLLPEGSQSNTYTVTLYDLSSWEEVQVQVDETLCLAVEDPADCSMPRPLLGAHPSNTGELWPCYLEKALAAHCGGWDNLDGGSCVHAWRMLTGCRECYSIQRTATGNFACYGTFNPNKNDWEALANNPNDGYKGLWRMAWPAVGGGGASELEITENELFERMCAWDDANFIMATESHLAANQQSLQLMDSCEIAEEDGIIDDHCYTVIAAVNDVADTEFDLLQVRNPWGTKEIESGMWDDDGPGWDEYPHVKEAIAPVLDQDDGVFWLEKNEFFHFFNSVQLCACDMSQFLAK